jgi:hypothetical protein
MNLAATLARAGQRVLLVDTDPQCNLTSYLIAEDVVDDLLDNADSPQGQTIWSAVQPVAEALGGFRPVRPLETAISNLFLLPGDIRLSEYETDLAEFWSQCLQRKPKGFRGTTAVSELVSSIAESLKIDYVFFDSGPNSTIADLAPEGTFLLPGRPRFLGYVPGGFRVYGGAIATQHSRYLSEIEREIHSQIVILLRHIDPSLAPGSLSQFKLGEMQNFGSLVPASQREGLPLYDVHAGTPDQRRRAKAALDSVGKRVQSRIGGQS